MNGELRPVSHLCGLLNPWDAPAVRCNFPKGHGPVRDGELGSWWEHGNPAEGAWWSVAGRPGLAPVIPLRQPERPGSTQVSCRGCGGVWWQLERGGGPGVVLLAPDGDWDRIVGYAGTFVCNDCGQRRN